MTHSGCIGCNHRSVAAAVIVGLTKGLGREDWRFSKEFSKPVHFVGVALSVAGLCCSSLGC
jgi:hypothetical protein